MWAYRISVSAELFPWHCQVLFLLWNKHLQEVTDKLVTTLKELPGPKRSGVLDNIKSRLEIKDAQTTKRTLTSHTHEWLLLQGNLQRVPFVAHPEQRVEQRVTPIQHSDALPLKRITEAPPIIMLGQTVLSFTWCEVCMALYWGPRGASFLSEQWHHGVIVFFDSE